MNRVTKRTWLMGLFIFILLGGMVFFLWEYATQAQQWVAFTGSPHVYNNSNIGTGTIVDRSGEILLDIDTQRSYAASETTRKSTLHWLGDRKGFIDAAAVTNYAAQMVGFDLINGVYAAEGEKGVAQLTISAKVQNTALEALGDRKGTVAVYNYKTGEILCAVTNPTFDPDNVPDVEADTSGKYEGVYLNRFIQSTYIPGSIYKVVTTAAALDCVKGIENMTFHCTGIKEYGTEKVSCETAHGTLNLKGALASSCNCSFAEIAELIGKKKMVSYVEKFGVADSITFDGVTTAKGNYDVSQTAPVSFAWSCIGQHTDQVNPASFMTFMGAVAGGGVAAEPYLVANVRSGGDTTYRAKVTRTDRILSKDVAKTVQEYMRNNTQIMYGDQNFPGLKVCAKSGTSQLGGGAVSNAMFAGFVMNEEYPLAFMVVVENGGYGASTCVPVISKVLAACKSVLDSE